MIPDYVNNTKMANLKDGFDANESISLKNKIIRDTVGDSKTLMDKELTSRDNAKLWSDMYDFCYKGYNTALESIKNDKIAINKCNDTVMEHLDALKKGINDSNDITTEKAPETSNQQQESNESTLESTMQYYFLDEADPVNPNPTNANPTVQTAAGASQNGNDNKNEDPNSTVKTNQDNSDEAKKIREENEAKHKALTNAIQSFYNANCQLMSAKMKICMNMYKQYMKLLRWYVSRYNNKVATTKKDQEADTSRAIHIN